MSWILHENYHFFVAINQHAGHSPLLDAIMIFFANDLIFFWPVILLLLWGRPLSWRKRPLRLGEVEIVQECHAVVLWIAVACILASVLNMGIDQMIFEPRPFVSHAVHLLISHPADDSFPSDHTTWSFAVVGMLLFSLPSLLFAAWHQRVALRETHGTHPLLRPLVLMGIALVIACSIGVARVFVGVHYPGDILGGMLSGMSAAGIITALRRLLRQPTEALLRFAEHLHLA